MISMGNLRINHDQRGCESRRGQVLYGVRVAEGEEWRRRSGWGGDEWMRRKRVGRKVQGRGWRKIGEKWEQEKRWKRGKV